MSSIQDPALNALLLIVLMTTAVILVFLICELLDWFWDNFKF